MKLIQSSLFSFLLLISVAVALCVQSSQAQEIIDLPKQIPNGFEGREFYLGFFPNEPIIGDSTQFLMLYVAGRRNTVITISHWDASFTRKVQSSYALDRDTALSWNVPYHLVTDTDGKPEKKGIHLTASNPVVVYGLNSKQQTSDMFIVPPANRLGKTYTCITMPNDHYEGIYDFDRVPRLNGFLIVAAFDSTTIQFTPKSRTLTSVYPGQGVVATLMAGETYLVRSWAEDKMSYDLSGTMVRGTKPFLMLSGHERTSVPQRRQNHGQSKDHLIEAMIPLELWGTEYLTAELDPQNVGLGDYFKVVTTAANTTVTVVDDVSSQTKTLAAIGDVAFFETVVGLGTWTSDKPIALGQLLKSPTLSPFDLQDPCLVAIPPMNQRVGRTSFFTPEYPVPPRFAKNFIRVIADEKAASSLKLDGRSFVARDPMFPSTKFPGLAFYSGVALVNPGLHFLSADSGGFTAVGYGVNRADSYGTTMGMMFGLSDTKDSVRPKITFVDSCGRVSGEVVDESGVAASSGVAVFDVLRDSTFNYSWDIRYGQTGSVSFSAQPTNRLNAGKLVADAIDHAGNRRRFRVRYAGIPLSFPDSIVFFNLKWTDTACVQVLIVNTADSTVTITSLNVSDSRMTFVPALTFPLTLRAKDTLKFTLCFEGQRSMPDAIGTRLEAVLDCSRYFAIPVHGKLKLPKLDGDTVNYGRVRLCDTICRDLRIRNIGNYTIRLDSLVTKLASQGITIKDSASVAGKVLAPFEITVVKACFIPDARGGTRRVDTVFNSEGVSCRLVMSGEGVAPDVRADLYDFGKVRVGVKRTAELTISNQGNDETTLRTISQTPNSTAITIDSVGPAIRLRVGDTLKSNVAFLPFASGIHQRSARYETDWRCQLTLESTVIGEGTLPTVSTHDIDFGNQRVFSITTIPDTSLVVAGGNEELTIDTARVIGGDFGSFIFSKDWALLKGKYTADAFKSDVTFVPTRAGLHEMFVEVTSDAAPAFQRVRDTVIVRGTALRSDTVDISTLADTLVSIPACGDSSWSISFFNNGNVLTKVAIGQLTASAGVALLNDSLIGRVILLDSGSSGSIVVRFQSKIFGIDTITITLRVNDTSSFIRRVIVNSIPNTVRITESLPVHGEPGKRIEFSVAGEIDAQILLPLSFSFRIPFSQKKVLIDGSLTKLSVTNGSGERVIPIVATQTLDSLTITSLAPVEVEGKSRFDLSFEGKYLLHDENVKDFAVYLKDSRCFTGDSATVALTEALVCANGIRFISVASDSFGLVGIHPNPTTDEVEVYISQSHEGRVSLSIFNSIGTQEFAQRNLFLTKGLHTVNLTVGTSGNGIYTVVVCSDGDCRNKKFIIQH